MGGINRAIGIIAVAILTGIGINIYMSTQMSANTTGWNATIVQMGNNWLPLTFLAVVLIIVIMTAVGRSKA